MENQYEKGKLDAENPELRADMRAKDEKTAKLLALEIAEENAQVPLKSPRF